MDYSDCLRQLGFNILIIEKSLNQNGGDLHDEISYLKKIKLKAWKT